MKYNEMRTMNIFLQPDSTFPLDNRVKIQLTNTPSWTSQVAVYIHVCPDSYHICIENFDGIYVFSVYVFTCLDNQDDSVSTQSRCHDSRHEATNAIISDVCAKFEKIPPKFSRDSHMRMG